METVMLGLAAAILPGASLFLSDWTKKKELEMQNYSEMDSAQLIGALRDELRAKDVRRSNWTYMLRGALIALVVVGALFGGYLLWIRLA
jgi:hypothetical protein